MGGIVRSWWGRSECYARGKTYFDFDIHEGIFLYFYDTICYRDIT